MVNAPIAPAGGPQSAPGPLRIAMVAPPWFSIPPGGYGGTETVIANLVEGLVARGDHVSLIASGKRGTSAQAFAQVFETPPSELIGDSLPELIAAVDVEHHLANLDVDVIHDHSLAGPLSARHRAAPTVVTVHGPSDGLSGTYFSRLGTDISAVAISMAQRRRNPAINWLATVHNAVDVNSFTADRPKEDFVLWLGRFSPDKAPELAIKAARSRGRRIVLAGKCAEPAEKEFFAREVKPLLGPDVEFVGEADASLKRDLLSRASALVFPIQWEEPFGMVMVEALASGTPVVAFNRGSVPEVVRHGTTGTIATTWDEFCAGIDAAFGLDPAACREDAVARFDLAAMADAYARAFAKLPGVTAGVRRTSRAASPGVPGRFDATRVA